jgi:hypothetical protein
MAFELDALHRSAGITALTDTEEILRHVYARPLQAIAGPFAGSVPQDCLSAHENDGPYDYGPKCTTTC